MIKTYEKMLFGLSWYSLKNEIYYRYISDLILIEKIFPIKKCGIQNPNLKKLKEFVWTNATSFKTENNYTIKCNFTNMILLQ